MTAAVTNVLGVVLTSIVGVSFAVLVAVEAWWERRQDRLDRERMERRWGQR